MNANNAMKIGNNIKKFVNNEGATNITVKLKTGGVLVEWQTYQLDCDGNNVYVNILHIMGCKVSDQSAYIQLIR